MRTQRMGRGYRELKGCELEFGNSKKWVGIQGAQGIELEYGNSMKRIGILSRELGHGRSGKECKNKSRKTPTH